MSEQTPARFQIVGVAGNVKYARIREDVPATVYFPHSQIFDAERDAILSMVLRETAAIVLAGISVGVLAAWAASNLLKTRLFGLTPHDPWSIGLSDFAGNDASRIYPGKKGIAG